MYIAIILRIIIQSQRQTSIFLLNAQAIKSINSLINDQYQFINYRYLSTMENSVLAKSMRTLTAITARLKELSLSSKLVIPDLVVAGSKCGGKSSTIEKLIGFQYLPREYNTETQRIQFHFIYTPNLTIPEAQIVEHINKGSIIRYADFDKLRDHINKLTIPHWNNSSPNNPIIINIYSSFMPNLTIVDLPGYSRIVINASYQDKLRRTRQMIESQIKKPRSIFLGVFGANVDLLCCNVLKMMRQCDPKGFRTLAAVPKVDIMDRGTNALSILKNQEIALRNGYIGIKNRSSQDRKNISIEQALVEQESFFKNSKFYHDLPRQFWGTETLSLKIVNIIYEQIMKQLKAIAQQLKQNITITHAKIQQLSNLGIFFENDELLEKKNGLKVELEHLEVLQKMIDQDPFFAKVLQNHKQNPQDYNEISENFKPVEMIRPRKRDFYGVFRPQAPVNPPPPPPKPKIYANSEQRQTEERRKMNTFNRLFGI